MDDLMSTREFGSGHFMEPRDRNQCGGCNETAHNKRTCKTNKTSKGHNASSSGGRGSGDGLGGGRGSGDGLGGGRGSGGGLGGGRGRVTGDGARGMGRGSGGGRGGFMGRGRGNARGMFGYLDGPFPYVATFHNYFHVSQYYFHVVFFLTN